MAAATTGSVGIILDSSILVAFERRRFEYPRAQEATRVVRPERL